MVSSSSALFFISFSTLILIFVAQFNPVTSNLPVCSKYDIFFLNSFDQHQEPVEYIPDPIQDVISDNSDNGQSIELIESTIDKEQIDTFEDNNNGAIEIEDGKVEEKESEDLIDINSWKNWIFDIFGNFKSSFNEYFGSTTVEHSEAFNQMNEILINTNALILTSLVSVTLVILSICYLVIKGVYATNPLKKQNIDLKKSLWKLTTAFENQQEEYFEIKDRANSFHSHLEKINQLGSELTEKKKIEIKYKDKIKRLQSELNESAKVASDAMSLIDSTILEKQQAQDENEKLKLSTNNLQNAIKIMCDKLESLKADNSTLTMDIDLQKHNLHSLKTNSEIIEKLNGELKEKLATEIKNREEDKTYIEILLEESSGLQESVKEYKDLLLKYEETVGSLNTEICQKENELAAFRETLGEDSPLADLAETMALLRNLEEEKAELKNNLGSLELENKSLSDKLSASEAQFSKISKERDEFGNRLSVIESYYKEKDDELLSSVEKFGIEKIGKDKRMQELLEVINKYEEERKDFMGRFEDLKEEFEDAKLTHKIEINSLEDKYHENWLQLCQAEKKTQALQRELDSYIQSPEGKDSNENGLHLHNGDHYPILPPELIPLPITDDPAFLGMYDFVPPPPLDESQDGEEQEDGNQERLAPLGSPNNSDFDDSNNNNINGISSNHHHHNNNNNDNYTFPSSTSKKEFRRQRKRRHSPERNSRRKSSSSSSVGYPITSTPNNPNK